jgi:CRP/FNR family transcriptional regulator, cyclic AMP receptor protein
MKTRPLETYLSSLELFRDLPPADLDLIVGCAKLVRFREGASLAREGAPADRFYVVREGRVALETHIPQRGALVVDTAGPGEAVGYSWIFPPYRWQFDARAVTPVRAFELDGACLRNKCDQDPRLGYALMKRFARLLQARLRSARIRLLDVYGDARTG